ncbi:MAG: ureidoglycolate lyase [Candidatus Binataceae bacterium]
MEETIKVKVEPLTAEAFRLYGRMLEIKEPIFPEVEPGEGRVAIELLTLKRPGNVRRLSQMAIHFSYNQTFIPVRGTMALIVAPPPRNRGAGHDQFELQYEKLAAFIVEPGHAAFIEKGTWHNAVALGEECQFINVTRKDPGEGTTDLGTEVGTSKAPNARPYVEFLDFRKRDRRVIELEL